MEDEREDLRFECAFSEKALRYNPVMAFVPVLYVGAIVLITLPKWWVGVLMVGICLALWVWMVVYMRRLARDSYLEITADGMLVCSYRGRSPVTYPIKEITDIKEASFKEARKEYAAVPVALNTRGDELWPPEGVLIRFRRSWLKSIFPVSFNPKDIPGFIAAIRNRMVKGTTPE